MPGRSHPLSCTGVDTWGLLSYSTLFFPARLVWGEEHGIGRKQVELAMREVNQQTKKLLTVIASVENHTARYTNDIDSFKTVFTDRLGAMTAANDLLVKNEWKDMRLASAVDVAIAPFPA